MENKWKLTTVDLGISPPHKITGAKLEFKYKNYRLIFLIGSKLRKFISETTLMLQTNSPEGRYTKQIEDLSHFPDNIAVYNGIINLTEGAPILHKIKNMSHFLSKNKRLPPFLIDYYLSHPAFTNVIMKFQMDVTPFTVMAPWAAFNRDDSIWPLLLEIKDAGKRPTSGSLASMRVLNKNQTVFKGLPDDIHQSIGSYLGVENTPHKLRNLQLMEDIQVAKKNLTKTKKRRHTPSYKSIGKKIKLG